MKEDFSSRCYAKGYAAGDAGNKHMDRQNLLIVVGFMASLAAGIGGTMLVAHMRANASAAEAPVAPTPAGSYIR